MGKGVQTAVGHVNEAIAEAIVGLDALDQRGIDRLLLDLDGTDNKAQLGANAILGVSLAVAARRGRRGRHGAVPLRGRRQRARAAGADDERVQRRRARRQQRRHPGVHDHAGRRGVVLARRCAGVSRPTTRSRRCSARKGLSTAVGDEGGFAPNLGSNEEAVQLLCSSDRAGGVHPRRADRDRPRCRVERVLHATGVYLLAGEGRSLNSAELAEYLAELAATATRSCRSRTAWPRRTGTGGALLTERPRVAGAARRRRPLRHQHRTADAGHRRRTWPTRSWSRSTRSARSPRPSKPSNSPNATRYTAVISHRSGETEDTTIADLAVATNCGQIKTGAPARSDRVAKYNQLLRIEAELGETAEFLGGAALARGAGQG